MDRSPSRGCCAPTGRRGQSASPAARRSPFVTPRSITEPGGNRRVYLATDTPVSLSTGWFPRPDDEPLTFVELRLTPDGDGEGKLSDAARLFVDSGNVIAIGDYNRRPVHLLAVRAEPPLE